MPELDRKLRWLIAIRMLVVVSVALPYSLFLLNREVELPRYEEVSQAQLILALLTGEDGDSRVQMLRIFVAVTSIQTLIYIALLRLLRRRQQTHAYIQFVGDLLLITLLIFKLGEPGSSFSVLYFFVISIASVLLRRSAGLIVATLAYALYATLLIALSGGWFAGWSGWFAPPPAEWFTGVSIRYNLTVHGLGFYGVAIMTSYLATNAAKAEEKLRLKHQDLAYLQVLHRDVIQSISSGLAATDLAGVVTSLNRAGENILGRSEDELVGQPITATGLFTPEQWLEQTQQAGAPHQRSELQSRRGGETIYIGFTLTPLRDGEGIQRGYILIFQDLTEWHRLREQLRLKDRMAAIGEMAAGLAHEVGNPLTAISGSVQVLSATLKGDPSQRKLLEITLKESQRLDRTVKGFLRFARPHEHNSIEFDVAALLAEDVELLRNSEEVQAKHRIVADLVPPSVKILADRDQVGQVFWNLARNALQAMPTGGQLTIVGRRVGDVYRMEFRDTGSGMSEEERANLFHPFKSFFDRGTGIGMAIVYRIVEEHQGEIHVDSELGKGSVIRVELPVRGRQKTVAGPRPFAAWEEAS